MYRLVVKGSNIRQVSASVEAHDLINAVQRIERLRERNEWIVDLVSRPLDMVLRTTLNGWYLERPRFVSGYGFPDGTLLFWTEVESTLISAEAEASAHLDEALSRPMPV